MANTHVYHVIGDAHIRGTAGGSQPMVVDSAHGIAITLLMAAPPALNAIATGATSGAKARVTMASGDGVTAAVVFETINLLAFTAGETINFDTGSSGILLQLAGLQQTPIFSQFINESKDSLLQSVTPGDLGDTPFWDRFSKLASLVVLASGYSGTFTVGQRVTTSGGGSFTVWGSGAGAGGTRELYVLRKSGTIAASQTVTGPTGSGTISTYNGDVAAGNWLQHSHLPNIGSLGTIFERVPQGSGFVLSDGTGSATIGVEKPILQGAIDWHAKADDPLDRGVRLIPYAVGDDFALSGPSLIASVSIQTVECSGTFPTSWTLGEKVSDGGTWSATVHSFNATKKYLHVTAPNGATITPGTISGGTSGASATAVDCHGWQKGSSYWRNWKANKDNALSKPAALVSSQPAKNEGAFLMIWENEIQTLGPGSAAAIPAYSTVIAEWHRFLADLRTELGNATMPISLFFGDDRQHGLDIPGGAFLIRLWLNGVAAVESNVTLTTAAGLEGIGSSLPYPSGFIYWRPLDYVEIGRRAWRSLQFAQSIVPEGNFQPLPLILLCGQSQAVGGIPFSLSVIDRDPDLYSSASFSGVSTVDEKVWMWNADMRLWQNYDANLNGNTFYGAATGNFGLEASLLGRMKFRFGTNNEPGEVGMIKLAVGGTSVDAASVGATATWDPLGAMRQTITANATVTAYPASGPTPTRGRFTAAAGTYSSVIVGATTQISGSALGLVNAGGNNTSATGVVNVFAVAPDGSWVEFRGAEFHDEGTRSFSITLGAPPLVDLVEEQIRLALEGCVTQLRRVPKPVLTVWWQAESDLSNIAAFKAATLRVLTWLEQIWGQKHKGETRTPTVIVKISSRTGWGAPDETIALSQQIHEEVAAELGNAATVTTDRLPLESTGVWPRTNRLQNGVHHTARGWIQAGYLIDAAADGLAGIPAFPSDLAGVDYFVDELTTGAAGAGGSSLTGGDSTAKSLTTSDSTESPTPSSSTAAAGTFAGDTIDAVEGIFNGGGLDVLSYSVNGRYVQGRSLNELIALHKYATALQQRSRGIRRTRVRFH